MNRRRPPFTLTLSLLGVLQLGTAFADQARRLDAVQVTATRQSESAGRVPTALTVVGAEEIDRRRATVMSEYLRGTPGVAIQRTGPGQGIVIVRGLKGSEVLHLVDGFRLNNAFFRNAPNQYLALVDPFAIERIELARGPVSTLYGSDAMGGVLQILTPTPRLAGEGGGFAALARYEYSSAERLHGGRAGLAAGGESWAWLGSLSYADYGRYLPGGDAPRQPFSDYVARGAASKLRWQHENQELTLSWQRYELPRLARFNELVPGFGARPESAESFFEPNERRFAQAHYRLRGVAGSDYLELRLGQQTVVDDRRTVAFGATTRDFEQNASRLRGLSAQGVWSWDALTLSAGIDAYHDRVTSARQRAPLAGGVPSPISPRFPSGSVQREFGAFVHGDWLASAVLDLMWGLRYTRYGVDIPPADRGVGIDSSQGDWTGQLGLRYSLSEAHHLVANLGRGFRAPNVFDYSTLGNRPGNRFNEPNFDLGPETVLGFDLGYRHFGERVSFELVGWASRYRDRLVSVDTGRRTATGRLIVRTENVGRSVLHGVESGFTVFLGSATDLYGSLNWTWGEDQFAAGDVPGNRIPPLSGRLGLVHRLASAWEFSAWSDYGARQDRLAPSDLTDPRIDPRGTAGYVSAHAGLRWQPSELPLTVQLRVENLTDKAYREHGSGVDQPGRGVSLSVEYRVGP